jgi:uncharacterized protein (TIGR02466 family)
MPLHTELWFPSVVWSGIIHVCDNTELKKFAYQKKLQDKGVTVSNYGGWQSNSIVAGESQDVDNLVSHLDSEVESCCKQTGLPPLQLYNLWININPPGSYNHLHNHSGSVISGVYYVEAGEHQGNIQFERSDNAEYFLPTQVEKITYFTSTRATYKSSTNALYLFPGWMKHSVEGNRSNHDRISISFNYGEKNAS